MNPFGMDISNSNINYDGNQHDYGNQNNYGQNPNNNY
jgi:hypothetical protein